MSGFDQLHLTSVRLQFATKKSTISVQNNVVTTVPTSNDHSKDTPFTILCSNGDNSHFQLFAQGKKLYQTTSGIFALDFNPSKATSTFYFSLDPTAGANSPVDFDKLIALKPDKLYLKCALAHQCVAVSGPNVVASTSNSADFQINLEITATAGYDSRKADMLKTKDWQLKCCTGAYDPNDPRQLISYRICKEMSDQTKCDTFMDNRCNDPQYLATPECACYNPKPALDALPQELAKYKEALGKQSQCWLKGCYKNAAMRAAPCTTALCDQIKADGHKPPPGLCPESKKLSGLVWLFLLVIVLILVLVFGSSSDELEENNDSKVKI